MKKSKLTSLKWLSLFIILIWLSGQSPALVYAQRSDETHDATAPIITDADETGLTLGGAYPPTGLTSTKVGDRSYSKLQMPYTTLSGQAGYPEVPVYSRLIGLPPTGEAELRLIEIERETTFLPNQPLPAPAVEANRLLPGEIDSLTGVEGGPTQRIPDPVVYTTDAFYPVSEVTLGPPQQLRDQRVASLTINPLRINPVTGQMEIIRFLRLEITFTQPASTGLARQSHAVQAGFEQALAVSLLNPAAAQWSTPRSAVAELGPQPARQSATGNETKILVNEAGLYALSYDDLQTAGLPVAGINPQTFQISHGYPRQQAAILEEGDGDAVFEPGERLLFYAAPIFSRFVDHDVYFLTYGGRSRAKNEHPRRSRRRGARHGLAHGSG